MNVIKLLTAASAMSLGLGVQAIAAPVGFAADCAVDASGPTGLTMAGFSCSADPSRTSVSNIEIFEGLGPISGDDDFYSLGLGGSLVIEFDPIFTGPAMVIEITNGGPASSHDEKVEIFGSNDGVAFTSLGFADNQTGINSGTRGTKTTIEFDGTYAYLGFKDISASAFPGTGSTDGFDIDAISVNPVRGVEDVPLPASAFMLLGALGGIGFIRARRQRS